LQRNPRCTKEAEVKVSAAALDDLPDVLTVDEAAEVLRISRNTAYALAKQWRESGGSAGLPVIELGPNLLRVPKQGLEQLLSGVTATR
jgi:excisionase family DNA binding protein